MLDVQFGQAIHRGRVRPGNQGALGAYIRASRLKARSRGYLFAVAGGTGSAGEASATAIAGIIEQFAASADHSMLISLLPHLIQHANSSDATAIVACALRYDQAVVSNIGGSRCYLVRDGQVKQISHDHASPDKQRDTSSVETAGFNSHHVPINSLGTENFDSPDTVALTLYPMDVLVLSSVGMQAWMSDGAIAEIVSRSKNLHETARELVDRAVEIDGNQNCATQVIRVRTVEQRTMHGGRTYHLPA
jgi:protein phosphatase